MIQILDWIGRWYAVKVDDQNRLSVKSSSYDWEAVDAEEGNAFIIHWQCHVAAATSWWLLYFKNTSSLYNVYITRIYIDAHSLTDDFIIKQSFDLTRANWTDISTTAKVNKNRQSWSILDGDVYISDGASDMTLTNWTQFHAFPVKSLTSYLRDMRWSNILTSNTSIGWSWETVDGANAVDGEIISFSINLYRELI